MADPFKVGDEVDVRFHKSIVTDMRQTARSRVITVLTADGEITFDVDAADTVVEKTGIWHDMRRCPQCSHPLKDCAHRDQYDQNNGDTGSYPAAVPDA